MITHKYGEEYQISFHRVNDNDAEILKKFNCEYPAISDFVQNECLTSKKRCNIFICRRRKQQTYRSLCNLL